MMAGQATTVTVVEKNTPVEQSASNSARTETRYVLKTKRDMLQQRIETNKAAQEKMATLIKDLKNAKSSKIRRESFEKVKEIYYLMGTYLKELSVDYDNQLKKLDDATLAETVMNGFVQRAIKVQDFVALLDVIVSEVDEFYARTRSLEQDQQLRQKISQERMNLRKLLRDFSPDDRKGTPDMLLTKIKQAL
jgi:hypothetical protein